MLPCLYMHGHFAVQGWAGQRLHHASRNPVDEGPMQAAAYLRNEGEDNCFECSRRQRVLVSQTARKLGRLS